MISPEDEYITEKKVINFTGFVSFSRSSLISDKKVNILVNDKDSYSVEFYNNCYFSRKISVLPGKNKIEVSLLLSDGNSLSKIFYIAVSSQQAIDKGRARGY